MKKVIRLTESDLNKIVKRVINEDTTNPNFANLENMLEKAMKGGGTDLDTIKLVFDQIKTKEDYLNLKKSFGMRGGQNLETWIGRDIWSGRDWDTYVKPFYEKIGVKISPVNSELQKVSDKVSSMFNESDLNRIVKRVVSEQGQIDYSKTITPLKARYSHTPENTNAEQIAKKMQRLSELGITNWGKNKIEIGKASPAGPRYWKLNNKSGNDYVYFDCTSKNGGKEDIGFSQFTSEEGEKLYNIFCKVL